MTDHPKYAQAEVERRWLVALDLAQTLAHSRTRHIEDRYVSGTLLRLRKVSEAGQQTLYKLGKKYDKRGPAQPVVSIYLQAHEHMALLTLPARMANKMRRTVAGGSLDIYQAPDHRFSVFEVEFDNPAAAAAYVPPDFVGEEITGLERYSGYDLAGSLG